MTGINPNFGHVSSAKGQSIRVEGTGFDCPDGDCSDLYCRFGNSPGHFIYVKGEQDGGAVKCKVPSYTKPDVVNVEVSINGESYTSDNKTFGFFDPFVLDASPRLISVDGSTNVEIKGIGFVDSGQTKAFFSNRTKNSGIYCGQFGDCSKDAKFIDKNTLLTGTFPQDQVKYEGRD